MMYYMDFWIEFNKKNERPLDRGGRGEVVFGAWGVRVDAWMKFRGFAAPSWLDIFCVQVWLNPKQREVRVNGAGRECLETFLLVLKYGSSTASRRWAVNGPHAFGCPRPTQRKRRPPGPAPFRDRPRRRCDATVVGTGGKVTKRGKIRARRLTPPPPRATSWPSARGRPAWGGRRRRPSRRAGLASRLRRTSIGRGRR